VRVEPTEKQHTSWLRIEIEIEVQVGRSTQSDPFFPKGVEEMKSRFNLVVLVVLVAMCMWGWTALGQRQSATSIQWEYAATYVQNGASGPALLNEFGAQGWELVSIAPDGAAYLKRQKK